MSTLKILDMNGTPVGDFDVGDEWRVPDRGVQAVKDAVVTLRRARRAGTASTLSKGKVRGSNRKPWQQKGTGRARAGYRQSPVWRGGGVAHGPHPRSYATKVNRKVLRLAFRRALSERLSGGGIRVVEALQVEEAKTKAFVKVMAALQVRSPVLFVMDRVDRNVAMAARNLAGVEVVAARTLNTYQVLRYPVVVVTRLGMEVLRERLQTGTGKAAR
jgi:large subunit ribosomal protein L4